MTPLEWFRSALPLRVDSIFINDPIVTLSGEGWSFTAMCPWALVGPGLNMSWETESIDDGVQRLGGRSIVSVSASDADATDPVLQFDGGFILSVTADTDLDPWWLDLPGFCIVGRQASPSD